MKLKQQKQCEFKRKMSVTLILIISVSCHFRYVSNARSLALQSFFYRILIEMDADISSFRNFDRKLERRAWVSATFRLTDQNIMKANVINLLRTDCHSHRSASVYLIFKYTVFSPRIVTLRRLTPGRKTNINFPIEIQNVAVQCAQSTSLLSFKFKSILKENSRKGFHQIQPKTVNQLFSVNEYICVCMAVCAALFSIGTMRTFKIPMPK